MRNEALAGPGLCRVTTVAPSLTNGKDVPCSIDEDGNIRVLPTPQAGDDTLADVKKVESRFLTIPNGDTTAVFSADKLVKSGAGFVNAITCYSDATATAGTIDIRDNTAAGGGNILWTFAVLAVAYNTPFTVPLQTPFAVGLFVDYTTTADLFCMVQYR